MSQYLAMQEPKPHSSVSIGSIRGVALRCLYYDPLAIGRADSSSLKPVLFRLLEGTAFQKIGEAESLETAKHVVEEDRNRLNKVGAPKKPLPQESYEDLDHGFEATEIVEKVKMGFDLGKLASQLDTLNKKISDMEARDEATTKKISALEDKDESMTKAMSESSRVQDDLLSSLAPIWRDSAVKLLQCLISKELANLRNHRHVNGKQARDSLLKSTRGRKDRYPRWSNVINSISESEQVKLSQALAGGEMMKLKDLFVVSCTSSADRNMGAHDVTFSQAKKGGVMYSAVDQATWMIKYMAACNLLETKGYFEGGGKAENT